MEKIDWQKIRNKLPFERTPEQKQRRKELWKLIDVNGNGYVSLAEIDKGMRDILQLDELFLSKPVMLRAYKAAKAKKKAKTIHSDDYIEFLEFRILL